MLTVLAIFYKQDFFVLIVLGIVPNVICQGIS